MRKPRRTFLSTVIVLLAVAVGGWILTRESRRQSVRLPNGARVTLAGWSYGREHILRLRGEQWWRAFFPPQPVLSQTTQRDMLVLFLVIEAPHLPPQQQKLPYWDYLEIVDETGSRVISLNAGDPTETGPTRIDHRGVKVIYLPNFPRRGRRLTVQFTKGAGKPPVAAFTLPNPDPQPNAPRWTPEPLPVVRKDGDLAVTLKQADPEPYLLIESGSETSTIPKRYYNLEAATRPPRIVREFLCPSFRLTLAAAGGLRNWKPWHATLTDAAGNVFVANFYDSRKAGIYKANFGAEYPAGETVGKLRVELEREASFPFPAGEQQTLTGQVWPQPHQSVYLAKAFAVGDQPIEAILFGGGVTALQHGGTRIMMNTEPPVLALLIPARQTDLHPMLRLTDEAGHLLKDVSSAPCDIEGGGNPHPDGSFDATVHIRLQQTSTGGRPAFAPVPPPGWRPAANFVGQLMGKYVLYYYALPGMKPGAKINLTFVPNPTRYVEFITPLSSQK